MSVDIKEDTPIMKVRLRPNSSNKAPLTLKRSIVKKKSQNRKLKKAANEYKKSLTRGVRNVRKGKEVLILCMRCGQGLNEG